MHLCVGQAHHILLWLHSVQPPDALRDTLASASTSSMRVTPLLPALWQGWCGNTLPCSAGGTALLHACPCSHLWPMLGGSSCHLICFPTTPVSGSPLPTSYCIPGCIYPLLCPRAILYPSGLFLPLNPCLPGLHATEIQPGLWFKTLWNPKMFVSRVLAADDTAHLWNRHSVCNFRPVQIQRTLRYLLVVVMTVLH